MLSKKSNMCQVATDLTELTHLGGSSEVAHLATAGWPSDRYDSRTVSLPSLLARDSAAYGRGAEFRRNAEMVSPWDREPDSNDGRHTPTFSHPHVQSSDATLTTSLSNLTQTFAIKVSTVLTEHIMHVVSKHRQC